MSEPADKEQLTRVEKYAQAHLDRVHTISAGATRTALLWLVALVIIWFQQLEPKLAQVRQAQLARHAVVMTGASGLQSLGLEWQSLKADDLAKKEQLELPFSIKFSLPPELITTLWLALAFGLSAYLTVTRRRVLRLAARGLRLLESDVNAEPPYVRTLVGEGVWWLTPLPERRGEVLTAEKFRSGLGWEDNRRWPGLLALLFLVALLFLLETRVFYIGFCIASFLPEPALLYPARWIILTAVNEALFLACVLSVWIWFAPASVPDALQVQVPRNSERRKVVKLLGKGAALSILAVGWAATATYLFARLSQSGREVAATNSKRRIRRKKVHQSLSQIGSGLFINAKTGTVHTAQCKRCLAGFDAKRLQPTNGRDIAWSERKLPAYLSALHNTASGQTPPSASNDQTVRYPDVDGLSQHAPRSLPHPHAAHRVFMIEQRVFDLLDSKDNVEASRLLIDAVSASPLFGLRETMRLYDLLAGLCVRFGDKQQLKYLVQIAEMQIDRIAKVENVLVPTSGPVLAFLYQLSNNESSIAEHQRQRNHEQEKPNFENAGASWSSHNEYLRAMMEKRISKWKTDNGNWYRLWTNTKAPVKWAGHKIN